MIVWNNGHRTKKYDDNEIIIDAINFLLTDNIMDNVGKKKKKDTIHQITQQIKIEEKEHTKHESNRILVIYLIHNDDTTDTKTNDHDRSDVK